MPFSLTKSHPRLWSLDGGTVMVVTDLHGDWDAYQRYRDRFLQLQSQNIADCLVFTGDLIHSELPEDQDGSLRIVSDIRRLQTECGDAIVYLCGNHELPHIYGMGLARGEVEYTPRFERALSESGQRAEITELLISLPFYLRSAAGVSLTHAGAGHEMPDAASALSVLDYDHHAELAEAERDMEGEDLEGLRYALARLSHAPSYESMARYYLAVSGPDDPRYNDLLRGSFASTNVNFGRVYDALFARCEKEYGKARYAPLLDVLLQHLSTGYAPQNVVVAGHIRVKGGYEIVGKNHLRLASAAHATPREAGLYLLFDASQPVSEAAELTAGLRSVFD